MHALAAPGLMAAALLAFAGAQKVVDPTMTVGALRSLGWPASPMLVRAGAAAELGLGVAVATVGGPVLWTLVGLSYLGFTMFVLAALRRGTMVGSCGCFGREDTPPSLGHVVLNLGLAGVALGLVASGADAALAGFSADPARSTAVLVLATVGVFLLHALYVDLPRAQAIAHDHRDHV